MTYYTGTQAASATIASDFMTTFDTYLISGGFTFVETYTSGTDVTNVYKSPAGSNSLAMDWYLFVNRTAVAATFVNFGVAEAYNSTTHLATKYAPLGVPTTANTTDYTVSDSGVLPSATASGASLFKSGATGTGTINTSTTYTWYFNVTADRVIFGKSTAAGASPQSTTYAGICDPLIDNWNVVIATMALTSSSALSANTIAYGSMTRDYGLNATVSTSAGGAYAWHCFNYNNTTSSSGATWSVWGPSGGNNTSLVLSDSIYGNSTARPYKLYISSSRGVNAGLAIFLVKDIVLWYGNAIATTTAGGDTLAITNSAGTLNYVRSDSYALASSVWVVWIPKQ